jgi:hypothetical protein
LQLARGEYFPCSQSSRKEGATQRRRIVIVLVAVLFLLALALQTSIAMAAPRLDRAVAAPRWDRALAVANGPRWE